MSADSEFDDFMLQLEGQRYTPPPRQQPLLIRWHSSYIIFTFHFVHIVLYYLLSQSLLR